MRPRNLRRRVAASAAVIVMMGVGAGYGARADAQTATLTGTFGINPRWSTVVDCPCEPVRYTPWISQRSIAQGVDKLSQRLSRQGAQIETVEVAGFSLGSVVAVGFIWDHPQQAKRVTFTLIGSPDTPEGRPSKGKGHKGRNGLPDGDWSNVSFVVRQFDPVSDPLARFNWLAAINASMSVHMRGYDNLDLTAPDAVHVDERTGARTLYYRTDVLPILAWRDWFTSDERMAELDAYYRPKIEAAYERPIDFEAAESNGIHNSSYQVHNPKPAAQEKNTWRDYAQTPRQQELRASTVPSISTSATSLVSSSPAISVDIESESTNQDSSNWATSDFAHTSGRLTLTDDSDRESRRESRREARTERRTR